MKKTTSIFKLIVVLILISMVFTGCIPGGNIGANTGEGFQKGLKFSPINGDHTVPPSVANDCACRSDKTEFNINFVILDFYYGGKFSENLEYEKQYTQDYPTFDLYFKDDDGNKVFVKRVFENFVSDKYRYHEIKNEYGYTVEKIFNHSEKLWIPKKLFNKEKGVIYFSLYGENHRYSEPKYETIASMSICYKVVGNKVVLSSGEL